MERFEKCRDSTELSNRRAGGDTPQAGKCCMEKFLFILLLWISYGTVFAHKTATVVCRMLFTGKTWKTFCKRWISSVQGEEKGRKVADVGLWQNKEGSPFSWVPVPAEGNVFGSRGSSTDVMNIPLEHILNSDSSSFSLWLQTHRSWSNVTQSFSICPDFSKH